MQHIQLMDIQARKEDFMRRYLAINDEALLTLLESMLDYATGQESEKEGLDPKIKEVMTARAVRAKEDVAEGRVCTREEAEEELNKRLFHPTKKEMVARAEASNRAIAEGRVKSLEQVRKESRDW